MKRHAEANRLRHPEATPKDLFAIDGDPSSAKPANKVMHFQLIRSFILKPMNIGAKAPASRMRSPARVMLARQEPSL